MILSVGKYIKMGKGLIVVKFGRENQDFKNGDREEYQVLWNYIYPCLPIRKMRGHRYLLFFHHCCVVRWSGSNRILSSDILLLLMFNNSYVGIYIVFLTIFYISEKEII